MFSCPLLSLSSSILFLISTIFFSWKAINLRHFSMEAQFDGTYCARRFALIRSAAAKSAAQNIVVRCSQGRQVRSDGVACAAIFGDADNMFFNPR